jgi:tetratricopeptide (TPR) repeat protein
MLSQRCISRNPTTTVSLLAAMLLLSACGGSNTKPDSASQQHEMAGAKANVPAQIQRDVPAQALTMFEQATSIMAAGDYLDAELRFKEFLLRYPDYPGAHVNLAIIHTNNGDDTAAQASIDAALALNPSYAPALNQQGMLYRKTGNFIEAEAAYLKAVTSTPDYALAHYNLGVLNELYLQRLEAALQHYQRYAELVSDDKQVQKWIADLTRRVAANQRTANVAE